MRVNYILYIIVCILYIVIALEMSPLYSFIPVEEKYLGESRSCLASPHLMSCYFLLNLLEYLDFH